MKEYVRCSQVDMKNDGAAKIGGLVCNKKAPSVKAAKIGGLVCNKKAPSVKSL